MAGHGEAGTQVFGRTCNIDRRRRVERHDIGLRAAFSGENGADRISVVGSDLLTAIGPPRTAVPDFGVLVCNPPYAAEGDVVQPEVLDYEPLKAIEAGPVGTEVYARLIPQAAAVLRPGRPLVLELGHGQAHSVPELLAADKHWGTPQIDPDFQNIPRVLTAHRR